MKILKEGINHYKIGTCPKCQAEFSFHDVNEATLKTVVHVKSENTYFYQLQCPSCYDWISIEKTDTKPATRDEIK
jgi:hypothetical protein